MSVEWWTDPATAAARLDALDQYWSDISNAALGRGVQPLVSEALANEVAKQVAAYRKWRATLGGFTNILKWRGPLEQWSDKANAMRALVAKAGANVPPEIETVHSVSLPTLIGSASLATTLIGVGLMWMITRGRR